MARYSLIMKDDTFVKALTKAQEDGLSFGKWINIQLDRWAKTEGKDLVKQCVMCGNKPYFNIKLNGIHNYLCKIHADLFIHAGYTVGGIPGES